MVRSLQERTNKLNIANISTRVAQIQCISMSRSETILNWVFFHWHIPIRRNPVVRNIFRFCGYTPEILLVFHMWQMLNKEALRILANAWLSACMHISQISYTDDDLFGAAFCFSFKRILRAFSVKHPGTRASRPALILITHSDWITGTSPASATQTTGDDDAIVFRHARNLEWMSAHVDLIKFHAWIINVQEKGEQEKQARKLYRTIRFLRLQTFVQKNFVDLCALCSITQRDSDYDFDTR